MVSSCPGVWSASSDCGDHATGQRLSPSLYQLVEHLQVLTNECVEIFNTWASIDGKQAASSGVSNQPPETSNDKRQSQKAKKVTSNRFICHSAQWTSCMVNYRRTTDSRQAIELTDNEPRHWLLGWFISLFTTKICCIIWHPSIR